MLDQEDVRVLSQTLRDSSPETFELLTKARLLNAHIETVVRSVVSLEAKSVKIPPDSLSILLEKVKAVSPTLMAEATVLASFSDDPDQWPAELDAYLRSGAPEGYALAKSRGRLDEHIRTVCALVRKDSVQENLDVRRALASRAQPIGSTFAELVGDARDAKAITPAHYRLMHDRFSVASDNEKRAMATSVVTLFSERPEFGRALASRAFESAFGDTEMYLYAVGAQAFGSGEIERAASFFHAAVQKFGYFGAYRWWANCLRALGKGRQALDVLSSALKVFPQDAELASAAAGTAFALGMADEANLIFKPFLAQYDQQVSDPHRMKVRTAELQEAIQSNRLFREAENDLYDDSFAESTWWNYWHYFSNYTRHQHSEGILAELVEECIDRAIQQIGVTPRAFVEIGTMCGEIIARVASRHPSMECFGVDRQECVKVLNDRAYALANLTFVAGDVVHLMEEKRERVSDGMLFHVRTAPFLYPAYLRHLYEVARDCGMTYIAFIEACSMSHTHREFRSFDEMEEIAEIRRPGLIHHNYPRVLREAGFEVVINEMLPPTLLSAGMDQSIFLVAKIAQ